MVLLKLPLGFRFCPKPHELIKYLTCKVTSEPLPCDGIIHHELNPYDEKQIPDIFCAVEKRDDVYLFTKLTKKGRIGNTNINRKVGKGTWHGGEKKSPVSDKGTQVGVLRKFAYREKDSQYNNKFMMMEYTLVEGTPLQYSSLKDYVLCRISKNGRSRNTNNVSSSDSDPMDLVPSTPSVDTHDDVLPLAVVPTIESQLIPDYGPPELQSFSPPRAPKAEQDEVFILTPLDNIWESCSELFDD